MKAKRTNHTDPHFAALNAMMDDWYYAKYGEIALEFHKHNRLDNLTAVVIMYDMDKPVACGAYRHHDDESVEIKRMFVLQVYRRRGVAKQLLRHLEDIARENGYVRSVLQTGAVMDAAIALYSAMGYEQTPKYGAFKEEENVVCMAKTL